MQLAQKHEARSETQPAQKQGNGKQIAGPRGSDIAQLEALAAASPRLAAQGAFAAQLAASPAMAEQGQRIGAIKDSPRMALQAKKAGEGAEAVQRVEEEEPMQGKFEPAQLVEEEEPLQGKFEAAQLVEEEEPLQGKFEAAQLVEEEEPLQGKFEAAQLVEEGEPLQGKFEPAQLVEEEEPLQGKFEAAQLVEEEEPLQGKFEPAQLVEEEEPLQGRFEPAQLVEEEEPLQGKFEAAQLVEEEEPLQGKFEPAQLVEEEEPLQGKFEAAQLVEEEEPLQGKFEPAQLVEEEEPLQGKFEPAQLVEEEEPLQGKSEPAQLVEEEEPLQGKFEPAQLVEEEEPLQGKFEPAQLVEEEEPLQGKFEPAQLAEEEDTLQGKAAGAGVAQREEAPTENKSGLPGPLKSGIESMSGMAMDHVKVHYNSPEPAQLNAHAFAQGSDIHVAPGQEQHLPHEAWHVVQQAQGRVQATTQMKTGTPVNDDVGLETEADVMGAKALETGKQVQAKADTQLKEIDPGSGTAQLDGRGRSGSVSGSAPGPSAEAAPSEMVTEEWTDFDDSLPEQAEAEGEEELAFSPNATPAEKASISRMGPGLKMGVQSAGSVAGGVKDVASTVEDAVDPVAKGADLFASSNSVWQHIKDGAVGVVGALASPIADMIAAALGMKTKWSQWQVFDETTTEAVDGKKVPKSDAPPEAVYALTKAPAGFMKYVKDMFMGVFNFVRNLLTIIPGAQFIAGPMAVFSAVVGLVDKLFKAGKKFYQFIKGEKKDTNSASLLDKAIAGDPQTLTLLLRLKLPSICGTGIGIVDELEAKALAAKSTVKRGLFGGTKDTATRVIDLMKPGGGGPTSESQLLQMLNLIKNSAASKDILRNDIKTTMTGYGV